MAFNDLSSQGALIWQQLSQKDKAILINTTSKQQQKSTGNSTNIAIDENQLGFIASTKNFTRKCCQRGTPSGELIQFQEIVAHRKVSTDDRNLCGSPYILSILW